MAVDNFLVNGLGGVADFGEQRLAKDDDNSSAAIDITSVFGPQGLSFLGDSYTEVFVNDNGNLTFTGPLGNSSGTIGSNFPQIAPFWADVDTRGGPGTATPGGNSTGSNRVYYDLDTVNHVFTVTWDDVGQFNAQTNPLNAFQVQLVQVSGGFDIIFRYESIKWAHDSASAGVAIADGHFLSLPASGDKSALLLLDTAPGNTGFTGVYEFGIRNGTSGDDILSGGDADDFIDGRGGNDTLQGGSGTDTLLGGSGKDSLQGGSGKDTLDGGGGIDTASYVNASGGVTVSLALAGVQSTGGAGADKLSNFENLTGSAFNDVLTGNASNNTLLGAFGNDMLQGGSGNDTLQGGPGNDTLNGGSGIDTASYSNATAGVTVSLAESDPQDTGGAGTDTLISIENLTGSAFADVLTGNAKNNILDGGQGSDTMSGGGGDDTYVLSGSGDFISGDSGGEDTCVITIGINYSLQELGLDFMENVTLTAAAGGVGGEGNNADNKVTLNDSDNSKYRGLGGSDHMRGLGGDDALEGGTGDDSVFGGSGDDELWGGAESDDPGAADGNDVLDGGSGADQMFGGNGNDTYFVDDAADVVVETVDPVGLLRSLPGLVPPLAGGIADLGDIVNAAVTYALSETAAGVERLTLIAGKIAARDGTGNDLSNILTGNEFANKLDGLGANDTLDGGAGDDTLKGGTGDDKLNGGTGKDVLRGLEGADVLTGGTGADRFDFDAVTDTGTGGSTRDRITDFVKGEDKIDLSTIDANGSGTGNGKFSFVGAFSADATGQLRFDAASHLVLGSTDADSAAEFSILLSGINSMTGGNFIL